MNLFLRFVQDKHNMVKPGTDLNAAIYIKGYMYRTN